MGYLPKSSWGRQKLKTGSRGGGEGGAVYIITVTITIIIITIIASNDGVCCSIVIYLLYCIRLMMMNRIRPDSR